MAPGVFAEDEVGLAKLIDVGRERSGQGVSRPRLLADRDVTDPELSILHFEIGLGPEDLISVRVSSPHDAAPDAQDIFNIKSNDDQVVLDGVLLPVDQEMLVDGGARKPVIIDFQTRDRTLEQITEPLTVRNSVARGLGIAVKENPEAVGRFLREKLMPGTQHCAVGADQVGASSPG